MQKDVTKILIRQTKQMQHYQKEEVRKWISRIIFLIMQKMVNFRQTGLGNCQLKCVHICKTTRKKCVHLCVTAHVECVVLMSRIEK